MDQQNKALVRVRYRIPVEVAGHRHDAGTHEIDVPEAEAAALVESGRAERVSAPKSGEPLKISDAERAKLPPLGPVVEGEQPTAGIAEPQAPVRAPAPVAPAPAAPSMPPAAT